MNEHLDQLIRQCINGDRNAQSKLYGEMSKKMFVVCLRYSKSREEAEEILQEGFVNLFKNLGQFKFMGSFEGWVKRIMINCALQKYRSKPQPVLVQIEDIIADYSDSEAICARLGAQELLKLVQQLPPGYRMVFNLYVFEGLKHKEIAALMEISEGTSKSNLFDARVFLQKIILQNSKTAVQKT